MPKLDDDRVLEHSILQESDAGPHVHAALDAGAGDDAVADRGVRIAEKKQALRRPEPGDRPGFSWPAAKLAALLGACEQSVPKSVSTYTGQADPILPGQLFSMTVCNGSGIESLCPTGPRTGLHPASSLLRSAGLGAVPLPSPPAQA